ncbi:hypothetical protein VDGL01_11247 [Verticillium dahliae]
METIHPYALEPWEGRIPTTIKDDGVKAMEAANATWAVCIATSSSARNDLVRMGGAIVLPLSCKSGGELMTVQSTVATPDEQSPYTAELTAMVKSLKSLPADLDCRTITILSNNKAAMQAAGQPRQQSGQENLRQLYGIVDQLESRHNKVSLVWVPLGNDLEIISAAKRAACGSTNVGQKARRQPLRAASTSLNRVKRQRRSANCRLPDDVGKHAKKVDSALPGKHTRQLYDDLTWKEASVLAQLRTGMARLNGYLHQIGVATTDQCPCGQAVETTEHFLFRCKKWTSQRTELLRCTETRRGSLSFYLGGKATTDGDDWKPNMDVVRATIRFALKTGRLDAQYG